MTLNPALTSEIQKLSPSAMVELFVLDATALGGSILRFHNGTNGLSQNLVWNGDTYVRFPIKISGFEFTGQGQFPRPNVQVSNALSAITSLLLAYKDLLGAKVTRKRTLVKFLDAVNFPGGVNPTADPTAAFDEDVYYVDRKASEDRDIVEFELAASVDLIGVNIPRRQIIQNVCIWKYRGAECGFTGAPLYDINDNLLSHSATTEGQAVIDANASVVAAKADLANKQAILNSATQAMGPVCDYQLQNRYYDPAAYYVADTPSTTIVLFNGSNVSLNATYRRGPLAASDADFGYGPQDAYYIEYWAIDTASCASATSAYNTALTNRDAAITALATANSSLASALAALATNDPLYTRDQCSKKLSSCKLRFGDNAQIPFGSFPGAGLIK